jgi:multiple sugar transport system permease protein
VTDPVAPVPPSPKVGSGATRVRKRFSLLTRRDKVVLSLMVGIPLLFDLVLIWGTTLASVGLSFTNWNGIGGVGADNFIGLTNYENLFTKYPFFWPAITHNLLWLGSLMFIATPIGILFAVLLDKELRGTRIYQSVLYLPVVLSLAIIGFIWVLQYAPEQGFINNILGKTKPGTQIFWLGDSSLAIWAVIVAACWRHAGYVMVLYLAGLKGVDPTLREAAKVDGANERQIFRRVVFPVMAPINIVVVVVTMIESFRAFDLVYVLNRGKTPLELLSTLITNNAVSESNRVGFGSAIAVVLLVISLGPILVFLNRTMREPSR